MSRSRAHAIRLYMVRRSFLTKLLALSASLLVGCGYQLVRSESAGGRIGVGVSAVSLRGAPQALGLRLRAYLREALNRVPGHRHQAGADTRLVTEVQLPHSQPVGFDADGVSGMYTVIVVVELKLEQAGHTVWASGTVEGRKGYTPGDSPYATSAARQRALEWAITSALDEALLRLGYRDFDGGTS